MVSKSFPKVAKSCKKVAKFNCMICDYYTSRKSSYTKHMASKKHLEKAFPNVSKSFPKSCKNSQKNIKVYICEYCNKEYSTRSGLWKHKKICQHKKVSVNEESLAIVSPNYEKMKIELAEQRGAIKALKGVIDEGKMGNTYNTNNTTNNNNITLNVFLNEHCKDALNLEDFMKNIHFQLKDVLNDGNYIEDCVSVKLLNDLNEIPVTKRPIHCTDQKRKNFVVKDKEEGWIKEKANKGGKIQKEIDKLYDKAYVEFYHAYDDEHPYPQNTIQEDLKQQTSHTINQKKDKHKIVGSVAKTVDVKEAMKDINNEDS